MEIPNLTGQRLDEGLMTLGEKYGSLNILINEYTIPDDFHKKGVSLGVKRIVRQVLNACGHVELTVFTFNETPLGGALDDGLE